MREGALVMATRRQEKRELRSKTSKQEAVELWSQQREHQRSGSAETSRNHKLLAERSKELFGTRGLALTTTVIHSDNNWTHSAGLAREGSRRPLQDIGLASVLGVVVCTRAAHSSTADAARLWRSRGVPRLQWLCSGKLGAVQLQEGEKRALSSAAKAENLDHAMAGQDMTTWRGARTPSPKWRPLHIPHQLSGYPATGCPRQQGDLTGRRSTGSGK